MGLITLFTRCKNFNRNIKCNPLFYDWFNWLDNIRGNFDMKNLILNNKKAVGAIFFVILKA